MVKMQLTFKGETMAEVRAGMIEWAMGLVGPLSIGAEPEPEAPKPPRKRSMKATPVEAPIPPEPEPATVTVDPAQIDLTDMVAEEEDVPPAPDGMGSEAVMEAATRFAKAHGKPALKRLLKRFKVAKVRDLPAAQQVPFVTACAAGPA